MDRESITLSVEEVKANLKSSIIADNRKLTEEYLEIFKTSSPNTSIVEKLEEILANDKLLYEVKYLITDKYQWDAETAMFFIMFADPAEDHTDLFNNLPEYNSSRDNY
jgi:hypothetical protein